MSEQIRFPGLLPYYAQIASRELAWDIFEEGLDAENDPNWARSGAGTPQEYAYWVMRACGIACVKMCVEGFGGVKRSMMDWVQRGLAEEGYLIVEKDGKRVERGWIHGKLARLMELEGLKSTAAPATLGEIETMLRAGCLAIASVSYELGTLYPVTFKGGHLVVVRGMDIENGRVCTVYINNPSGRLPALQDNATIPAERFEAAYTGRVIRVCGAG